MPRQYERFWAGLAGIFLLALVLRLAYVALVTHVDVAGGDAYYYHHQANLLASGHGLIVPPAYLLTGKVVRAADHPPAFTFYLALWSLVGLRSFLAHKVAAAFLGAAGVVVIGLLGRRVAGRRAGLVAAALAAVYPQLWVNDGLVMSETMAILAVAMALLAAYRLRQRPTPWRLGALGAACGLATLARSELILLVPLLAIPLALGHRPSTFESRRRALVLALAGMAVPLSPWLVRNALAFQRPVMLSTNFEQTLAVANCPQTYREPYIGFWWFGCITAGVNPPPGDQSEQAPYYRKLGFEYVEAHWQRLPAVVLARLERVWGIGRPVQQARFDQLEKRRLWVSAAGLVAYYLLVPLAVAGAVTMRRRRVSLIPMLALPLVVTTTAVVTYGNTRFRVPAEVGLVVLAAVAADAFLGVRRSPPSEPVSTSHSLGDSVLPPRESVVARGLLADADPTRSHSPLPVMACLA